MQDAWLRWSATDISDGEEPGSLPDHGGDPAVAGPAAHAQGPPRGLLRSLAARTGRRRRRPARPRPSWPTRCRWPCWWCWRPCRRWSGPPSCCARCSPSRTPWSPRSSAATNPPYASWCTAPGSTSTPARARYRADRATHGEVVERFLAACQNADLDALLAVLAPDVAAGQ